MRQNSLVSNPVSRLKLQAELFQAFVRALKPLLVSVGYPSEMVDRFIAGTDKGESFSFFLGTYLTYVAQSFPR